MNRYINHVVELHLDNCSRSFGVAPCTASNATGFECFNTKFTCQDTPNFLKANKVVTLSEVDNGLYPSAIPCIVKNGIDIAATQINPKESLAHLGKVTIRVQDFPHNDVGLDPYYDTRPYEPIEQGTFWGKLLARSPHVYGRTLKIKQIVDGATDQTYEFVIESISPPDSNGVATITGKDPLFLAGGKKAKAPTATNLKLTADISDTATTIYLDDVSGLGAGTYRIGSEIITCSGVDGPSNTLTGCARAQWGTTAEGHSTDDAIQLCIVYENEPLINVVNDLITNYTAINNSFVPFAEWQAEETDWLSIYTLTRVISEPTEVLDLLTEIQIETGVNIWWSLREQKIKLRAAVPRTQNQSVETLTDDTHLSGNIVVKDDIKQRVSQVWMYFGMINQTEQDEPENYRNLEIRADFEAESDEEYGTEQIEVIHCKWLTGAAQAGQVASRKLSRYRNSPKTITFSLDHKDAALKTGDHFHIQTASIQSKTGAAEVIEMQMLSMRYMPKDMSLKCKAQTFNYLINQIYGYVAPDATPDYLSATETQRNNYGFICGDDGKMSNGDNGYLVI